jgi:hypothetical protein
MEAWHRLVHSGVKDARSKNWPIQPPTIYRFCEIYDLPLAGWAIENAELHGWNDQLELAESLKKRHEYLCSLSPAARMELYKMQGYMRRLESDREWSLKGYVQTGPGRWSWGIRLLQGV